MKIGDTELPARVTSLEARSYGGSEENEVLVSKDGMKVGITRGDTDLLGVEVTTSEEVKPRSNASLEEKDSVDIDVECITTSDTELLGVISGDGEEVEPRSNVGLEKKEVVGKDTEEKLGTITGDTELPRLLLTSNEKEVVTINDGEGVGITTGDTELLGVTSGDGEEVELR